jgi:hypothetical protein
MGTDGACSLLFCEWVINTTRGARAVLFTVCTGGPNLGRSSVSMTFPSVSRSLTCQAHIWHKFCSGCWSHHHLCMTSRSTAIGWSSAHGLCNRGRVDADSLSVPPRGPRGPVHHTRAKTHAGSAVPSEPANSMPS